MSFNAMATQEKPDRVIANDGFFPELSLRTFLDLYRLPGEYAADLVADHLSLAVIWANRQLEAWKEARKGEGCSTLGDVPLHGVPGASLVVYQRAVFCQAKGMLLAQFRTVERREAANNDAKEGRETADVFFAFAHDALADLLGAGRVDIALI